MRYIDLNVIQVRASNFNILLLCDKNEERSLFYDNEKPFATLPLPSKRVEHPNSSKNVEFSISPKKGSTKVVLAKRPSFTSYVDENDEIDGTVQLRKSVKVPI